MKKTVHWFCARHCARHLYSWWNCEISTKILWIKSSYWTYFTNEKTWSLGRLSIFLKVTQLSVDMGLPHLKTPPAPHNYLLLLVFVCQPRSLSLTFLETHGMLALWGHLFLVGCTMSFLGVLWRINKCSLGEGRKINASDYFSFIQEHKGVGAGKV